MTNARDKANIPVLNFQSKGIDDNASSTAVTILSDGKIGIGTVNPVRELHVDGSTSSIAIGKNGSGSATLRFYSDGSQKSYIQLDPSENMVYYAPSGTEQQFYASGSEKMRLTGTGLGVGTSSPAKRFHVHGSGSEIARFEATGGSSFIGIKDADDGTIAYIGVDAGKLKFETSGSGFSDKLVIDTAGNVGIGETAPLGLLHVKSGDSGASVNSGHNQVIAENSGNSGMTILSGTSSNGAICYGDSGNNCIGYINYAHNGNHLDFGVNNAERMRIDSSGNVAIGHTTSGGSKLAICDGANAQIQFFPEISTDTNLIQHYDPTASAYMASDNRASQYLFKIGTTEKVRIDSSGNVGIGTTSPGRQLQVSSTDSQISLLSTNTSSGSSAVHFGDSDDDNIGQVNYQHSDNSMRLNTNAAERMRIQSNGQILVAGTTAGDSDSEIIVDNGSSTGNYGFRHQGSGRYMRMGCPNSAYAYFETNSSSGFLMDGNTFVNGALSKSSGSFKIDHPLPEKTNTHHLVHSFVEAPQADNIYRGKIDLVNGTATINIDTNSAMSDGTFVLLNTNIQCFTSNETGWTAVKGSVSENILTITAQDNTCDDTISWMVIGERQDQHMIDTDWTDENGKIIVEPLKETEQQQP